MADAYSSMASGANSILSALFQPKANIRVDPISLKNPAEAYSQFADQKKYLGGIGDVLGSAESLSNQYHQGNVLKYDPFALQSAGLAQQSTAGKLAGGLGLNISNASGTGFLGPRDLDLTSEDLFKQGASEFGGEQKAAAAWSPFHYSSNDQLLSPANILEREDSNNYYNNAILNQRNAIDAQIKGNPWWLASMTGANTGAAEGASAPI